MHRMQCISYRGLSKVDELDGMPVRIILLIGPKADQLRQDMLEQSLLYIIVAFITFADALRRCKLVLGMTAL